MTYVILGSVMLHSSKNMQPKTHFYFRVAITINEIHIILCTLSISLYTGAESIYKC